VLSIGENTLQLLNVLAL